jgi:hypothetical protein
VAKSPLTPTDLAKRVGRAGPRVNTVLRQLYPQLAPGVGGRWLLTDEMVEAVTAYFAGSSSRNVASVAAGDSAEQRAAESTMLELLGRDLGVTFAKHRLVSDGGAAVEVDGVSLRPPVLVECFAHQGALRVGQKHKVTNDAFKLAWAGTTLLPGARRILLFSDEAATAPFRNRSWAAAAIAHFGIEIRVVELPEGIRGAVRRAQERQFRLLLLGPVGPPPDNGRAVHGHPPRSGVAAGLEPPQRVIEKTVPAKKTTLRNWMAAAEREVLREQWQIRPGEGSLLPLTNGAVENSIGTLKRALANRAVQFGNLERLNKTLGLMCLQQAGKAARDVFEELIRAATSTLRRGTPRSRTGAVTSTRATAPSTTSSSGHGSPPRSRLPTPTRPRGGPQEAHRRLTQAGARCRVPPEAGGRRRQEELPDQGPVGGRHPVIGGEWYTTENGNRDPRLVPASSRERVKWQCHKDPRHIWEASIIQRSSRRSLGGRSPQELLLRETEWDPIKADPATLLIVSKQPREEPPPT